MFLDSLQVLDEAMADSGAYGLPTVARCRDGCVGRHAAWSVIRHELLHFLRLKRVVSRDRGRRRQDRSMPWGNRPKPGRLSACRLPPRASSRRPRVTRPPGARPTPSRFRRRSTCSPSPCPRSSRCTPACRSGHGHRNLTHLTTPLFEKLAHRF